jgi:nucleoside-diphosphate-sugar epimerase
MENNRVFKEMNSKQQLFITGISGFVGQNLNHYLVKDFDVQGISRKKKLGKLTYGMFLEENRPYDAMIHLAGKAHDLKKTSHDNEYYEVNFELTKRLFDQFLRSDAQKFIYISSVKAVADTVDGVLTEEAVPNPVTAYGKSKLMAEKYILEHLPNNKQVYILRPCMIHGVGNKGNLNLLHSIVSKGIPYPLGAFKNVRSFLSIENLCFIIKELLDQKDIPSGVYHVADDVSLSTNKVIELMGDSLGTKSRIWNVPCAWVNVAARLGNHLHLPLNTHRLQKLTESYVVGNAKIKLAIGKSLPVKTEDGLLKTFGSFTP